MESLVFDVRVITLACPHCSYRIKKPIGWFKSDGHSCPRCGAVCIDADFSKTLDGAETALAKLGLGMSENALGHPNRRRK